MSRLLIPKIATVKVTPHWHIAKDGDPAAINLYERHYSCHHYKDGRIRKLIVGPGERIVLLTENADALFVWRRFRESGEIEPKGVNCAVFRTEDCPVIASELIAEARYVAWGRWPGERLYTYVDPESIESSNPGYCFKCDGWVFEGRTKGGLHILARYPDGAA